jgi:tetratricopeptide (TPR) repeat protein
MNCKNACPLPPPPNNFFHSSIQSGTLHFGLGGIAMLLWLWILLAPLPAEPGMRRDGWAGETVVARDSNPMMDVNLPDGSSLRKQLNHVTYRVIRESEDRVWLRQGDEEGSMKKTEVVRVKDAEEVLNKQIEENPANSSAQNRRAVIRERIGNIDGALSDYSELIERNPNRVYYNNRATVFIGQNDYDYAVKDLDESLKLGQQYAMAYKNRCHALWGMRHLDEALADIESSIKLDPSYITALIFRGYVLNEMGEYERAFKDVKTVLAVHPNDLDAITLRAEIFFMQKKYTEALAGFSQAVWLDGQNPSSRISRAKTLAKLGRHASARYDHDEAIAAFPKIPGSYSDRGRYRFERGDYEGAKTDFEAAFKLRPKHLHTLDNLAWMHATCPDVKYRNADKAIELATLACERTANRHGGYLDTLAAAHAEKGDFAKALETLKKAREDKHYARYEAVDLAAREKAYQAKQPWRDTVK